MSQRGSESGTPCPLVRTTQKACGCPPVKSPGFWATLLERHFGVGRGLPRRYVPVIDRLSLRRPTGPTGRISRRALEMARFPSLAQLCLLGVRRGPNRASREERSTGRMEGCTSSRQRRDG